MRNVLLMGVLAMMAFAPAFAEEPSKPEGRPSPEQMFEKKFAKDDLNGDGNVSKEEYMKSMEERFTKMDINGDGNVSKDEAKAFHAEKHNRMMKMKEKKDAVPAEAEKAE